MQDLDLLLKQAQQAIACCNNHLELAKIRTDYLGKKSVLTDCLQTIGKLPAAERRQQGQAINQVKEQLQALIQQRTAWLDEQQIQQQLASEKLDVTLPGRGRSIGNLHPVTRVRQRLEDFSNNSVLLSHKAQKLKMIITISLP